MSSRSRKRLSVSPMRRSPNERSLSSKKNSLFGGRNGSIFKSHEVRPGMFQNVIKNIGRPVVPVSFVEETITAKDIAGGFSKTSNGFGNFSEL